MNRTYLEGAAEALATKRGYAFFTLPDDQIARAVTIFPAAVLTPLALRSAEGRRHGRLTYDMTLRLLHPGAKLPPEGRRTALAEMETDLLQLFAALSDEQQVLAVEALTIRPASSSLTPHGELSQTAMAQIITTF